MKNEAKTDLSERLRQIQFHFKLTNEALAKLVGVSGTAIGDIINGKTQDPRISVVNELYSKLGVDLNWLLTGEGQMLKQSLEIRTEEISGKANPETDLELQIYKNELNALKKLLEEKDLRIANNERMINILQNVLDAVGFESIDKNLKKLLSDWQKAAQFSL